MSNNASRKRAAAAATSAGEASLNDSGRGVHGRRRVYQANLVSEDEESMILRDIEQRQALAARLSKWTRPPLSADYVAQSRSVVFQQLEIDYVIGESHRELLPNLSGPTAIIRIFGVTKEGHSVCCNVHGFEPYFYICCPPGMGPDDISHFHLTLEEMMRLPTFQDIGKLQLS